MATTKKTSRVTIVSASEAAPSVQTPHGLLLTGNEAFAHYESLDALSKVLDALARALPRLPAAEAIVKIDEALSSIPASQGSTRDILAGIRAVLAADADADLTAPLHLWRLSSLRNRADEVRVSVGFAAGAVPKAHDKYTVQPVSAPRTIGTGRAGGR